MKKVLYLWLFSFVSIFAKNNEKTEPRYEVLKYKDGIIAQETWYNHKNETDSIKSYYRNGKPCEFFYFDKNQYHGTCYKINGKGEKITTWEFDHGVLLERINHIKKYNQKNKKNVLKAYEIVEKANKKLAIDPNNSRAIMSRTYGRYLLGDRLLAMRGYLDIINKIKLLQENGQEINSTTLGRIYDTTASIYASYEQENKASHYYYLAVKTDTVDTRLVNNLGTYLVANKSYRLGIYYLNKVLDAHPRHAFAHRALGDAYIALKDYKKALEHLNIAFESEQFIYKYSTGKTEKNLQTLRGYVYHKLGETEKGLVDLNEALKLYEDNTLALRYIGEVYLDLKENEKACKYLTKSKELGYEKNYDRDDLEALVNQSCHPEQTSAFKTYLKPYASPNPVKTTTEIMNYPYVNFKYKVMNYQNNIVLEGISNNKTIDLSSLSSGLYVVLLLENGEPTTFKVIKD